MKENKIEALRKGGRRKGRKERGREGGSEAKQQAYRTVGKPALPLDVRKLMIKMSSLKSLC